MGFGLVAAAGFLIWRLLYPEPLKIEEFTAEKPTLIEGDEVRLNWKISNYKQLKNLIITTKQPPSNEPLLNESKIDNLLINQNKKTDNALCRTFQEEFICNNFKTGITAKGKYEFEIKASYPQRQSLFSQRIQNETLTTNVEIKEKEIAEVLDLKTDKVKYQKGENIILNWSIIRPELLDKIEIITKVDEKTPVGKPIPFKFKDSTFEDPKLKDNCQGQGKQIKCQLSLSAINTGNFIYDLKAYSLNINDRTSIKSTENRIEVLSKPFNIVFFKINGSEQANQVLNEGKKAVLTWRVEGEDIQVQLLPYGEKLPQQGEKKLDIIKNFPSPITLEVTDISGKRQPQQKSFAISVKEKQATPNPFISPFAVPLPKNNPF